MDIKDKIFHLKYALTTKCNEKEGSAWWQLEQILYELVDRIEKLEGKSK